MNYSAALLLLAIAQQALREPTEVERAATDSRTAIKSGEITLRYVHRGALDKDKTVTTRFDFRFDELNRFMKVVNEGGPELYPQMAAPQTTRHVLTSTQYMTHSQYNVPSGVRLAAFVDDLRLLDIIQKASPKVDEYGEIQQLRPFDPRLIGFMPVTFGFVYHKHLDSYICGTRVATGTAEPAMLEGIQATQVTYRTPNDCEIVIWICSERDHCPIRIDLKGVHPDGTELIDSMQAQLEQFDDDGDIGDGRRWFPKKIVQSRTVRTGVGTKVLDSEEITVMTAAFNRPIDKSNFTLTALEMPENTLIIHRPENGAEPKDLEAIAAAGQALPLDSPLTKWSESNESSLTEEDMAARRKHKLPPPGSTMTGSGRFSIILWINVLVIGAVLLRYSMTKGVRRVHKPTSDS